MPGRVTNAPTHNLYSLNLYANAALRKSAVEHPVGTGVICNGNVKMNGRHNTATWLTQQFAYSNNLLLFVQSFLIISNYFKTNANSKQYRLHCYFDLCCISGVARNFERGFDNVPETSLFSFFLLFYILLSVLRMGGSEWTMNLPYTPLVSVWESNASLEK